ncbi:MAG: trypsin-like peptidase domain-containing protein [Chthoniobacterales bacterium]|nr:trypsin-like peptidase domain-containing protein [Chthoniobacterales bacterium]
MNMVRPRDLLLLAVGLLSLACASHAIDVDQLKPSVLRVVTPVGASGSSFVVCKDDQGCVLATNAHVVSGSEKTEVFLLRASSITSKVDAFRARVIWFDEEMDLALLRAPGLDAEPLVLSNFPPAQVEEVYSFGFPGVADDAEAQAELARIVIESFVAGLFSQVLDDPKVTSTGLAEVSISKGGVRRVIKGKWDPSFSGPDFLIIEHDVNITSGNSGGPLLNECGQVVGINTQRVPDPNMPMDVVRKSSHTSVLIAALRAQSLSSVEASAPCTAAAAQNAQGSAPTPVPIPAATPASTKPATTPASSDSKPSISPQQPDPKGTSRSSIAPGLVLLAVVVFLLATAAACLAVVAVVRRPATVTETYTQYLRRKPDARGSSPPVQSAQSLPGTAVTQRLVLEGFDPDKGPASRITIPVDLQKGAGKVMVGRKRDAVHVHLGNVSVSGQHVALWSDAEGRCWVEDRNSSNGTRLNGHPLKPLAAARLKHRDQLQVGDIQLTVNFA